MAYTDTNYFIAELDLRYAERMNESNNPSIINRFPTLIDALEAFPELPDTDKESIRYSIISPFMDTLDNLVLENLESCHGFSIEDDYNGSDVIAKVKYGEPEFNGEPHVSVESSTVVEYEATFSPSMLRDKQLLGETLDAILTETDQQYAKNQNTANQK